MKYTIDVKGDTKKLTPKQLRDLEVVITDYLNSIESEYTAVLVTKVEYSIYKSLIQNT